MLLPSNASLFNGGRGAHRMPVKDAECAAPLAARRGGFSGHPEDLDQSDNVEILYGIDYDTFDALKPFMFLSGGKFQGPYDAIIDDIQAEQRESGHGKALCVGDTMHDHGPPFPRLGHRGSKAKAAAS